MHLPCLQRVEDILIKQITTSAATCLPFNLTKAKQDMKQYDWDREDTRECLWKDGGNRNLYGVVARSRALACPCGGGLLRKELAWPPRAWVAPRRRPKAAHRSSMPSIFAPPSKAVYTSGNYRPAVQPLPEAVTGKSEGAPDIPGAVYRGEGGRRGVVTKWVGGRDGWGHITNTEREEKVCLVRGEVVVGVEDWSRVEGRSVEYTTHRKGKKREAVTAVVVGDTRVVKGREDGVVTHWVEESESGVVRWREGEVVVTRGDFRPGCYLADMVGRQVTFLLDPATMEAAAVVAGERVQEVAGNSQAIAANSIPSPTTMASPATLEEAPHLVAAHLEVQGLLLRWEVASWC